MSAHFAEMYNAFYVKEHTSLSGRSDIMNYVPTTGQKLDFDTSSSKDEYRYFDTPPIIEYGQYIL